MWLAIAALAAVLGAGYLAVAMSFDRVEQPEYRTVTLDGNFEVRAYGPMVVAEVTVRGDRREAVSAAFSQLAAYIFAKERGGETVPMTAPVTQTPREKISMTAPVTQSSNTGNTDNAGSTGDGEWNVRFVMPKKYTLESLPKPQNSNIRLIQVPDSQKAAVRFSGVATDALLAEQEQELRKWMQARGLQADGAPTYAYYNAPFTPGFLRRNEVLFEVAK